VLEDTMHYGEIHEPWKCSAKNFSMHNSTMWVLNLSFGVS